MAVDSGVRHGRPFDTAIGADPPSWLTDNVPEMSGKEDTT